MTSPDPAQSDDETGTTTPTPQPVAPTEGASQRIDKWLWYARFFKTRSKASTFVNGGNVRVSRGDNANRIEKAATPVQAGDVLSFMIGQRVRIIEIAACGTRRGPAPEAQTLYHDRSPPPPPRAPKQPPAGERDAGQGRPTKKERRAMDAFRRNP
ncbi:MAG: RNA-binding S4 domain-containing protein [Pseudomonadota bacterium]